MFCSCIVNRETEDCETGELQIVEQESRGGQAES